MYFGTFLRVWFLLKLTAEPATSTIMCRLQKLNSGGGQTSTFDSFQFGGGSAINVLASDGPHVLFSLRDPIRFAEQPEVCYVPYFLQYKPNNKESLMGKNFNKCPGYLYWVSYATSAAAIAGIEPGLWLRHWHVGRCMVDRFTRCGQLQNYKGDKAAFRVSLP